MLVRVAIDLALDRLFTYEVPEALQKKLAVGQLLSVPFGYREARGFVLGFADEAEKFDYALKPVSAILDETPFFSAHLLELVKRVAAYTAAPIESVLKAALPAAVLHKNAKPRELMYIEPALAPAKTVLTKRQQWLYDQIVRLGGGWMSQICNELKTSPATIRELGVRGLVSVEIRAKRRDPLANRRILPTKPRVLNEEQARALEAICRDAAEEACRPVLLHGITGSGKTEVYLQAIGRELERGRGAVVLVPEISLTPQTVQRFAGRFGSRVAVLHSALSDGERYDEWHRIRSGEARVVVGPRSAVWAPVANLGLIVVDEEHEGSYKQDETPHYNARDVAVLRGSIEGARVVLGSATPSLESWMNVKRGKYRLAEMRCRAGGGSLPGIRLVDMGGPAGETPARRGAIFSPDLLESIRLRLDRQEQTILFLNRRGYSRSVTCSACGHVVSCPNCASQDGEIPYTYHRADNCLRCHVCGSWIPTPAKCPKCGAGELNFRGIGTQRVEQALKTCFPRARVLRMDADSTSRKQSHDDILGAFGRLEADILIGTQMIAKGLDFPNVTLVGILNADSSLNMPDFRAAERTYQLLAQVAGRAGRSELPGEVLIQTNDPASAVLLAVRKGDCGYAAFADAELKVRESCFFPPACHLAIASFRAQDARLASGWCEMYAKSLANYAKGAFEVSAAMPSAIDKADGWYRWMIVLRAASARQIVGAWKWITRARPVPGGLRIALDVDALNIV